MYSNFFIFEFMNVKFDEFAGSPVGRLSSSLKLPVRYWGEDYETPQSQLRLRPRRAEPRPARPTRPPPHPARDLPAAPGGGAARAIPREAPSGTQRRSAPAPAAGKVGQTPPVTWLAPLSYPGASRPGTAGRRSAPNVTAGRGGAGGVRERPAPARIRRFSSLRGSPLRSRAGKWSAALSLPERGGNTRQRKAASRPWHAHAAFWSIAAWKEGRRVAFRCQTNPTDPLRSPCYKGTQTSKETNFVKGNTKECEWFLNICRNVLQAPFLIFCPPPPKYTPLQGF